MSYKRQGVVCKEQAKRLSSLCYCPSDAT